MTPGEFSLCGSYGFSLELANASRRRDTLATAALPMYSLDSWTALMPAGFYNRTML